MARNGLFSLFLYMRRVLLSSKSGVGLAGKAMEKAIRRIGEFAVSLRSEEGVVFFLLLAFSGQYFFNLKGKCVWSICKTSHKLWLSLGPGF